jgi:hypothetical protein
MDGASKFVKGDAIASVLILVINIIGGLVLGTVTHGLSIGEAAETYILLAIGDALVASVPALLLSIAAASIVTRVASPLDLSGQIASQFGSARAWAPVAGILTVLGVLPGMPHFIILARRRAGRLHRLAAAQRQACRSRAGAGGRGQPEPDRLGRSVGRRCPRPGARLRPHRPGRRAQGRAAHGPHHRHPPPALARARLRGPARSASATISRSGRTSIGSSSPA